MTHGILTINAGSSSIKFALFELNGGLSARASVSGQIDGIETSLTRLSSSCASRSSSDSLRSEAWPATPVARASRP